MKTGPTPSPTQGDGPGCLLGSIGHTVSVRTRVPLTEGDARWGLGGSDGNSRANLLRESVIGCDIKPMRSFLKLSHAATDDDDPPEKCWFHNSTKPFSESN